MRPTTTTAVSAQRFVAAASRRAAICSPLSADMILRATQFFECLSQIVEAGGLLHGGELTPGDGARVGMIDSETWFATHPQGARR